MNLLNPPAPAVLTERGAQPCVSALEVARKADIVIAMVQDTANVEDVLFGENGAAKGLFPGKTVVDMNLDVPFITSIRRGGAAREWPDQPFAGSLFACRPGVRGLEVPGFRG